MPWMRPGPESPVGGASHPPGNLRGGRGFLTLDLLTLWFSRGCGWVGATGGFSGGFHGGHLLSGSGRSGLLTSLALPLPSCGTLSKSLHLSGPQLPDLQNEGWG